MEPTPRVYGEVRYFDLKKENQEAFYDMVEVLFDPRNLKDSCWGPDKIVYHINALGNKKDDRGGEDCLTDPSWNGDAMIAVHIDGTLNDTNDSDSGYIVELAVSWKELGVSPEDGLRMGVNFANGDNDGKGRQISKMRSGMRWTREM